MGCPWDTIQIPSEGWGGAYVSLLWIIFLTGSSLTLKWSCCPLRTPVLRWGSYPVFPIRLMRMLSSLHPFPPATISCSPSQSHSMCSCVHLHKQVCGAPPCFPRALLRSSVPCWDALQVQPVLGPHPHSWLTLPSLLYCPGSPKSCFQVLPGWGLPHAQGSSSEFTLSYNDNVGFEASRDQGEKTAQ